MLKLDFSNIITKSASRKRKTKEKIQDDLGLGDIERVSSLPKKFGPDFVELYAETLEEVLLPYVVQRQISLSYAARYREMLVETVLGSGEHLGMLHYLKEKDTNGSSYAELVQYAEQLIVKGWRIVEEDGRFWLLSAEKTRVIDLTGAAPLYAELEAIAFDEGTAHVFLPQHVASSIYKLAEELGYNADTLASSGRLDILGAEVKGTKISGYLENYEKLKEIFKKEHTYGTESGGITIHDLYTEDYRLSSTLVANDGVVLERDGEKFILVPVSGEMTEGIYADLLGQIAYKIKKELAPRVVMPTILEVKDFNRTFAYLVELLPDEFMSATFGDSFDAIGGMQDRSALAELTAMETFLLGNPYFGPSSFVVEGISRRVYSHHHRDYFKKTYDLVFTRGTPDFEEFGDNTITLLAKEAPGRFLDRLRNYTFSFPEYPYDLSVIAERFEDGKRKLL